MRPLLSEYLVWYRKRNFKDAFLKFSMILSVVPNCHPLHALTDMKKFLKTGITAKICQRPGGISKKTNPQGRTEDKSRSLPISIACSIQRH